MPNDFIPLSFTGNRNARWVLVWPADGRRVTVNAAFFREIKQDAQRLREIVNTINLFAIAGVFVARGGDVLVRHLSQLLEHVRFHFALEDAYGYFNFPLAVEPEIARRAAQLAAQHAELVNELESLYGEAQRLAAEPAWHPERTDLAETLKSFMQRLELHERQENDLIETVLNPEFGPKA